MKCSQYWLAQVRRANYINSGACRRRARATPRMACYSGCHFSFSPYPQYLQAFCLDFDGNSRIQKSVHDHHKCGEFKLFIAGWKVSPKLKKKNECVSIHCVSFPVSCCPQRARVLVIFGSSISVCFSVVYEVCKPA